LEGKLKMQRNICRNVVVWDKWVIVQNIDIYVVVCIMYDLNNTNKCHFGYIPWILVQLWLHLVWLLFSQPEYRSLPIYITLHCPEIIVLCITITRWCCRRSGIPRVLPDSWMRILLVNGHMVLVWRRQKPREKHGSD
jgi:hypothetical protein